MWGQKPSDQSLISQCSKVTQKENKTSQDWVRKVTHWELNLKSKIWRYEQEVYAQPRISLGEWNAETFLKFWDINGSSNQGQMSRFSDS